jgi:hypothetical protein
MSERTFYITRSDKLAAMFDEFIEGPFRLKLEGTTLLLRIEDSEETAQLLESGRALADRYVSRLGQGLGEIPNLMTEEDFRAQPSWSSSNILMTQSGAAHHHGALLTPDTGVALRDARNAVISYNWPLRACYDYMQTAIAHPEKRLLAEIFKMVETMENHIGGERALIRRTGLTAQVKFLKELANEHCRDERHAPDDDAAPLAITEAERTRAREYATTLLRNFEELCRTDGVAG